MSSQRASQLVEAGAWLQATGDSEGAQRLFEQALRLDPGNLRARQLMSRQQQPSSSPPKAAKAPPAPSSNTFSPRKPPAAAPSSSPSAPAAPRRAPGASLHPVPKAVAPSAFRGPPSVHPVSKFTGPPASSASPALYSSAAPHSEASHFSVPPVAPAPPKAIPPRSSSGWDYPHRPGVNLGPSRTGTDDPLALLLDDPPVGAAVSESGDFTRAPALNEEVESLLRNARDRLELDDHSGAMDLILKALELAPNDPAVQQMRAKSEQTLQSMLESKLGSLTRVPRVVLKDDEIIWLNLDHRAGFVLAQIDGKMTFDDVFAVSGMSRLDTARILVQLLEEGVIRAG